MFFNREEEIKEFNNILKRKPSRLYFVYGPINSGKTELISEVIENLNKEYKVFYINLRGKFLKNYEDFVRVLFRIEKKVKVSEIISSLTKVATGIPISKEFFEEIFGEKPIEDVFDYLEEFFIGMEKKGFKPVFILDELQMLRGLNIDGDLLYELFNFFVRLTKEIKICNVFCITSDSLFFEDIYNKSELQERAEYLLIDDFSRADALEFLMQSRFSNNEAELTYNYLGGKPQLLISIIDAKQDGKKIEEVLELMLLDQKSKLKFLLEDARELGLSIKIEEKEYKVTYEEILDLFEVFLNNEEVEAGFTKKIPRTFLIRSNLLFLEPVRGTLKPQSRLLLKAIREVLIEIDRLG
ncbi:MAG TPA: ATP-binding protein [Methanosarcinales archaeon]|nr:ATP-binding protein [Methanosarcinales archaeon]